MQSTSYMGKIFETMKDKSGFTILEVMIALVIFSVALLGLTSLSLGVVKANNTSKKFIEASILAQSTIEEIRNGEFDLGSDTVLGGGDDTISDMLVNSSATNDGVTDAETLFNSPDHAYAIDATGNETTPVTLLNAPSITLRNKLRRTWTITDDSPVSDMKLVTVVVGWKEPGTANKKYMTVNTAIQGD